MDSNHRRLASSDLQSDAFGHSATYPDSLKKKQETDINGYKHKPNNKQMSIM